MPRCLVLAVNLKAQIIFVLGTDAVEGAHVSSSGTLSFGTPKGSPRAAELPDGDRLSFLAPLQASLGTVPPQGRFWHAPTASNSLLLTWENVYAGRDTNSPVTFQAELFRNGDFSYRYAFSSNSSFLTPNSSFPFAVGAQHNGGGETYALNDTDRLVNGLELRWRAFSLLEPGVSDHDGDGLSTYDEVMLHGTNPSLKDSDGDGLDDADELAAGTAPLNPDSDGDLAADSIDPAPLTPGDPGEILNCCSNTWLFHVHHALPTNGTCGASGFPHDHNLFAVTVTLNAPVADPGAVLWIGGTPLVMLDPGSWTLWLDKATNQTVRLCAPRGVGVDYTVSSDVPGFFIQPPPPGPPAPPQSHTATPEGTVAVPFFAVEPSNVCFHGAPVSFRAVGCGYIPPANGSNTFFTLPVPRRPAAWPDGWATLSPWPSGHGGQGTPPNDPDDCGHGPDCPDCVWVVDHWHHKEETFKLFDHCGCCACPEHNPTVDGEALSLEPVVYEGAVGLTAAFRPFDGAPIPLAAGPLPGPSVVAVTGLTPSAAPYDRSAHFSRHIPSVPTTFYEVDRFTVLSLDLQPDVDLSGSVDAGDAAALAAEWDRKWLIPAGTNAFPLKVFNDVALPGVYTIALAGPSNVVARYGNVTVRSGESNAVAFPPGSTLETVLVQADGPGEAALTLSFKGSGAAVFECETQVSVKAYGVELDDGGIDIENPALNGIGTYVPGSCRVNFINGTNVWQTAVGASFPQTLELTLPHLGAAPGVSRVELELSGVSQLEGWCVNGRFASGSQTGDDFSFAPAYDLRAITVLPEVQYSHANARQILASFAHLQLFCKDTGGRCVLTATPYDGDDNAMLPVTVAIPLDMNGNGIADAWERDKVTQHNSVYQSASIIWSPALYADPLGDDEPAALGVRRTDGTYSHADTGDGLSVMDEYRGYVLDGGADFTSTRHVRLSPALKELLVQVNELPGMASQNSFNPAALSAYSFNSVMQQVAQFYRHPTRGLGIDLYWVRKDFMFDGPSITSIDGTLTSSTAYRYNGTLTREEHSGAMSTITSDGLMHSDWRFYGKIPNSVFGQLFISEPATFARLKLFPSVHSDLDHDFCKLVLIDRWCAIPSNLADEDPAIGVVNIGQNAFSQFADAVPVSQSGAIIAVAAIAEEGPTEYTSPYLHEYSASVFLERLTFSITHELAHLLVRQQFGTGWIDGSHRNSSTAVMGRVLPPEGLPSVTADQEEISKVNLRTRASATTE